MLGTAMPTGVAVGTVTAGSYVLNLIAQRTHLPIDSMVMTLALSSLFSLYIANGMKGGLVERAVSFVFNALIISYLAIGSFNTTTALVDNARSPPAPSSGAYVTSSPNPGGQ